MIFSYIYFFFVGLFILWIIKKRFGVKKVVIGHYHIPLKIKDFLVLEAYLFNNKVHKFDDFLVITDVHLGSANYKDEEFKELKSLMEKNLIILGDFFEKRIKRKLKKEEIKILHKALNNRNVIYIKGNHDPKIEGQVWYFIYKDTLFTHGHITFFPLYFFDLIKILSQRKKV